MNITSDHLRWIDSAIYNALEKLKGHVPLRIAKFVALYYTDARIRRLYSEFIGIKMGEGSFANLGLKVVPNDKSICVHIGRNVSIAPNATFICNSSANNGVEINQIPYVRDVLSKSGDIYIEDEVWIGANVTIFPNVNVGKCSVIGAGSVVTSDVEAYSIYAGTPAKKIRDLKSGERTYGL